MKKNKIKLRQEVDLIWDAYSSNIDLNKDYKYLYLTEATFKTFGALFLKVLKYLFLVLLFMFAITFAGAIFLKVSSLFIEVNPYIRANVIVESLFTTIITVASMIIWIFVQFFARLLIGVEKLIWVFGGAFFSFGLIINETSSGFFGLPIFFELMFWFALGFLLFLTSYTIFKTVVKIDDEKFKKRKIKSITASVVITVFSIVIIPIFYISLNSLVYLLTYIFTIPVSGTINDFSIVKSLFSSTYTVPGYSMSQGLPDIWEVFGAIMNGEFRILLFTFGLFGISIGIFRIIFLLISRNLTILYLLIVSPLVATTYQIDDGARFKNWFLKTNSVFFSVVVIVISYGIFITTVDVFFNILENSDLDNNLLVVLGMILFYTIALLSIERGNKMFSSLMKTDDSLEESRAYSAGATKAMAYSTLLTYQIYGSSIKSATNLVRYIPTKITRINGFDDSGINKKTRDDLNTRINNQLK